MKFKTKKNYTVYPGANGNAYSSSRYLYNSIRVTESNSIDSNKSTLNEGIDWEVDSDKKGGVIILSTDVNAEALSENKFVNWIKQKVATLKNRILSTKKIDKISQSNNLVGWTIGRFLDGRYTAKDGTPFGEKSLSVELIGVDTDTLIKVATELCNEFMQETVLVKDYTSGNIYFVNPD